MFSITVMPYLVGAAGTIILVLFAAVKWKSYKLNKALAKAKAATDVVDAAHKAAKNQAAEQGKWNDFADARDKQYAEQQKSKATKKATIPTPPVNDSDKLSAEEAEFLKGRFGRKK